MIVVRDDLQALFPERTVDEFLAIEGETVKQVVASRRTYRFERGGRAFYMKAHWGVGWREILKNWLQLKSPILGAENEWRAIQAFHEPHIGIETMQLAAYGKRGWNPARQRSFVMTEALEHTVDLEHWLPELDRHPQRLQALSLKRAVIRRLGDIGRRLHGNGMNHRDFYLCHFRVDLSRAAPLPSAQDLHIYLMDLHRVGFHQALPPRWAVKDIAGLLYSAFYDAKGLRITRGDILRFIEAYSGENWRQALVSRRDFWRDVVTRIIRTYQRDKGQLPALPAYLQAWYGPNP